ncbi:MAG TPA: AI-2E family transporter [Phycisphaerae bacterium]|nr:AI-2E family transporter [Phycisphaerae bacterium]HNU44306.1 AI-2E family transporter [Phycisphaerae bacterium]
MGEQPPRYSVEWVVRTAVGIGVLLVVLALLRYLADVLVPFAAAVVVAYLLHPLVSLLQRKLKRRGLAVGLTLAGFAVAALLVLAVTIPLTIGQVQRFGRDLSRLGVDADQALDRQLATVAPDFVDGQKTTLGWNELMLGWKRYRAASPDLTRSERLQLLLEPVAGTYVGSLIAEGRDFMQSEEFRVWLLQLAKRVAAGGWTVVTFTFELLVGLTVLIIVLVYLVFLLLDYPYYAAAWPGLIPPRYREQTVAFLGEFEVVLRRYLRAQAIVALLMALVFSVGFTVIGLPLAVPLGLFIGLLNMVPYLQAVGLVPALMLALMRSVESGSSLLVSVVLTLAVFLVAQLIQDLLITPRVMGKMTGLRPVAVLLGVFIWGKLLGFLGLLLAIPLTCLAIAYYRRLVLQQTTAVAAPAEGAEAGA